MPTDLLTLHLADRTTGTPASPPDGVGLRELDPALTPDLAGVYLGAYPPGVAAADLAEAVAEREATFRGDFGELRPDASASAWVDGSLAGAVMVTTRSIWDDDVDGPFVIDLFTAPDARGRGVGRALVRHAVGACAAAGDATLTLRVGAGTSEAALALYRELGFRPLV